MNWSLLSVKYPATQQEQKEIGNDISEVSHFHLHFRFCVILIRPHFPCIMSNKVHSAIVHGPASIIMI